MTKYFLLLLTIVATSFTWLSCNNPIGPYKPVIWTQAEMQSLVIPAVWAAGNVIAVGAALPLSSCVLIFRSTDNGSTWQMTDSIHVNNHDPNTSLWTPIGITFIYSGPYLFAGLAGGGGSIYRSSDYGMTWSDNGVSSPESSGDRPDILSFCNADGFIFAVADQGVFRSSDNGTSWSLSSVGPYGCGGLANIGTILFAFTGSDGIYRSMNNGLSWSVVFDTSLDFQGLASIGNKVFAGAFGKPLTGGVFVSSDYGTSWTHADSGLTDHTVETLIADGANLYAGTLSGSFISTNSGASWSYVSTGSSTDSLAVLSLAVSNSSLVVGTDDGVWIYPLSQRSNTKGSTNKWAQTKKEEP